MGETLTSYPVSAGLVKLEAFYCLLAWRVARPEIFLLVRFMIGLPTTQVCYSAGRLPEYYLFKKDFWYNSPADNPFSSIKRVKVVQVLHGLRRFSAAEHGWHLGVEGQCPDVVAFEVMITAPWEGAFYGSGGKQIVFSCCCFC